MNGGIILIQVDLIRVLCVCAIISIGCTFGNVFAAPAFPGAVGYGSDTTGGRGGAGYGGTSPKVPLWLAEPV